jgi:hypothetical protein
MWVPTRRDGRVAVELSPAALMARISLGNRRKK